MIGVQEVVSVVRDQLVGLMDNMKTGGIMTGHSWLQEPADADSGDHQVRLLIFISNSGDAHDTPYY